MFSNRVLLSERPCFFWFGGKRIGIETEARDTSAAKGKDAVMPKPTTHTDIVVVTKQDPSSPARESESVQVTLTSEMAPLAQDLRSTRTGLAEGPNSLLDTNPVVLGIDVNGQSLQLGYRVVVRYGDVANFGQFVNEPWSWGNQALNPAPLGAFAWQHANTSKALIDQLDLEVYGDFGPTQLTLVPNHVKRNGLTQLFVEFVHATRVVGSLVLTASMEAEKA